MKNKTPLELLRAAIEEQEYDALCDTLHELHGDDGIDCGVRNCFECKVDALRKAAALVEAELDALKARSLPEGMEWPRYDGGEPVSIGDQFAEHGGCENVVDSVEVGDCWFKIHGFDGAAPRYSKRASVKRPAPKVLDADGVEVRVGDTVYTLQDPRPYTVEVVGDIVAIRAHEGCVLVYRAAWALTHERPDSWERVEADAGKNPFDYCKDVGHRLDTCENSEAYKARDIVRRAKKLASAS